MAATTASQLHHLLGHYPHLGDESDFSALKTTNSGPPKFAFLARSGSKLPEEGVLCASLPRMKDPRLGIEVILELYGEGRSGQHRVFAAQSKLDHWGVGRQAAG